MGGAVAVIVSLVVYRVSATKIALSATGASFTALDEFLDRATGSLTGTTDHTSMRADARRQQQSVWTLGQSVAPAPFVSLGSGGPTTDDLAVMTSLANDAGRLARDISAAPPFAADHHERIHAIGTHLATSARAIGDWRAGTTFPPTVPRTAELARLDGELRSADAPGTVAQLTVVHDLIDIEEHLIDLLDLDDVTDIDERPQLRLPCHQARHESCSETTCPR